MTMREIKLRRRSLRERVNLLTTQHEQQRMRIDQLAERVVKLERPHFTIEPRYYSADEMQAAIWKAQGEIIAGLEAALNKPGGADITGYIAAQWNRIMREQATYKPIKS